MEMNRETKLGMMAGIIRNLRAENRQLREENARLRGEITEAQRKMDEEDMEVFRLARGEVKGNGGTWIMIHV